VQAGRKAYIGFEISVEMLLLLVLGNAEGKKLEDDGGE